MQHNSKLVIGVALGLLSAAGALAYVLGDDNSPAGSFSPSVVDHTYQNLRYGYAFETFGTRIVASGMTISPPNEAAEISILGTHSAMQIRVRDPRRLPASVSPDLVELWSLDTRAQAEAAWKANDTTEYDSLGGGRWLPFKFLSPLATTTLDAQPAYTFDVDGIFVKELGGARPTKRERHIFVDHQGLTLHIHYPLVDSDFDPTFESILATLRFN